MSEQPTSTGGGAGAAFKESMKKVGRAIDSGMSSFMKEIGQNIRAECPGCHKVILAPPNQFVQCPMCTHEFHSPTVSTRTGEVSRDVTKDIREAWGTHKPGTTGTGEQHTKTTTTTGHTTTEPHATTATGHPAETPGSKVPETVAHPTDSTAPRRSGA